jgi:hypothetical protein
MEEITRSPLILSDDGCGRMVYFKCDYMLPTGSFKYREAMAVKHFAALQGVRTVIVATSGNTGEAITSICKDLDVIVYTWDDKVPRIRVIKQVMDEYEMSDKGRTFLFAGSNNQLKMIAHQIMAREILQQIHEVYRDNPSHHYFQATGGGYGCAAVKAVWPARSTTVVPVRPEAELIPRWAPALADAPELPEVIEVSASEIYRAAEHLRSLVNSLPPPGLEAAVSLAGWWHWAKKYGYPERPPVINLTGALKGSVPW